jgi:hypothetical protein
MLLKHIHKLVIQRKPSKRALHHRFYGTPHTSQVFISERNSQHGKEAIKHHICVAHGAVCVGDAYFHNYPRTSMINKTPQMHPKVYFCKAYIHQEPVACISLLLTLRDHHLLNKDSSLCSHEKQHACPLDPGHQIQGLIETHSSHQPACKHVQDLWKTELGIKS